MTCVHTDVTNKIAHVTLNRAPANAFTYDMYKELASALYELNNRDDVAAVVLRAEGKIFCGGNDVAAFQTFTCRTAVEEYAEACAQAVGAVWNCAKPVIAAVQGACMGAGFALAVASDFVIAGAGVKFGLPEVTLGIPAAGCFADFCLPVHVAKKFAFTGEPMSAEELERWGVVMQVVDRTDVWNEADAFAEKIAAGCYRAVGVFKQTFNANHAAAFHDKFMAEQHSFMDEMMDSHDFKEAVSAFMEKRQPIFTGK